MVLRLLLDPFDVLFGGEENLREGESQQKLANAKRRHFNSPGLVAMR